jgi:hypothetical protein
LRRRGAALRENGIWRHWIGRSWLSSRIRFGAIGKIFINCLSPTLHTACFHRRLGVFPETAATCAMCEDGGGHGERCVKNDEQLHTARPTGPCTRSQGS